jgi:hypothetical protein
VREDAARPNQLPVFEHEAAKHAVGEGRRSAPALAGC